MVSRHHPKSVESAQFCTNMQINKQFDEAVASIEFWELRAWLDAQYSIVPAENLQCTQRYPQHPNNQVNEYRPGCQRAHSATDGGAARFIQAIAVEDAPHC